MSRILLVEDEILVRELAYDDLEEAGYEVLAAGDGDEALEILRDDRAFDLLFTDIRMPSSIDGHQLAAEARRLIPGLKVIYASGLSEVDAADAYERHLQKPYRRETLLQLIEELGLSADSSNRP